MKKGDVYLIDGTAFRFVKRTHGANYNVYFLFRSADGVERQLSTLTVDKLKRAPQ